MAKSLMVAVALEAQLAIVYDLTFGVFAHRQTLGGHTCKLLLFHAYFCEKV